MGCVASLVVLVMMGAPPSIGLKAESDRVRTEMRLPLQHLDPDMANYAQQHANAMAANQKMAHSGGDYFEVIGSGPVAARAIFNGWLVAKSNRDIVLGPYPLCGFGAAQAIDGTWYWCGVYARLTPEPKPPGIPRKPGGG